MILLHLVGRTAAGAGRCGMVHGRILLVQVSKRGQRGLRLLPTAVPPDPHIPCESGCNPQHNIADGSRLCIHSLLAVRRLTSIAKYKAIGQARFHVQAADEILRPFSVLSACSPKAKPWQQEHRCKADLMRLKANCTKPESEEKRSGCIQFACRDAFKRGPCWKVGRGGC